MAINELSPKQIENAKPRDTDYKITDGGSLYLLVKKTGGKYWRPDNTQKLPEEIALSEGGISTREIKDLWHLPILFLLIAALRCGEWLLRRRWGAV